MAWERRRDTVWEQDANGVYAVSATAGEVLVLHGSAGLIWEVLDGSTTDEIVNHLVDATGADRADIAAEVSRFLQDLTQRELVMQR